MSNTGFRVRSQFARVSSNGQIKNFKLRKQIERLSVPKNEYIPKDPYKYSDFRGLLSADFKDAISNAFDQETLDRINLEEVGNTEPNQETQVLIDKIKASLQASHMGSVDM
jgi:hypothetical protein